MAKRTRHTAGKRPGAIRVDPIDAQRIALYEQIITILLDQVGGSVTLTKAAWEAVKAKYGGDPGFRTHFVGDPGGDMVLELAPGMTANGERVN